MSLSILSGKFKGRVLKSPSGKTRPTLSILKKSLFDRLQSTIHDAVFVDLFAGSGAIGLEAISRGASKCFFAESDLKTYKVLCENVHILKCENVCIPMLGKAHLLLKKLEKEGVIVDIFYIDPPYDIREDNASSYPHILQILNTSPLVSQETQIFVENDNEKIIFSYLEKCENLKLIDTRSFCDSFLHLITKK